MTTAFHKKPNMYASHLQLKVKNLNTSLSFYETVLGFSLLEQDGNTAYLTNDGKTSMLSLVEQADAISHEGYTGLYHIAFLLPTRKDLGNIIQHFIAQNVRVGAGDHDVSEALYINDPDGNGIEIYTDRPADQWRWDGQQQVYMTTEQLNAPSILADADGSWNGLPEGTVIGHVHLSVSDLAKTEQFYTNVLQYEIVTRYGGQALFASTGGYHHHFGFNTWQSANRPARPDNATGLVHFTVVLKDADYAAEVRDALQAAGADISLVDNAPKYGGEQLFSTVDPNGIRILFTTDGE